MPQLTGAHPQPAPAVVHARVDAEKPPSALPKQEVSSPATALGSHNRLRSSAGDLSVLQVLLSDLTNIQCLLV